jgi:beta-galactosidase/beta-glucuronidase
MISGVEVLLVLMNFIFFCYTVSIRHFGDQALAVHKQMVSELIRRDKNSASVVAWSLGNECSTQQPAALPYFT